MKPLLPLVAGLLLAGSIGCDRMLMPQERVTYAAWEEGLTLGFENPALADTQREAARFQIRVKESKPLADSRSVVLTQTSLTGQADITFLLKDGGEVVGSDPAQAARVLPEGFPERVSAWEARGIYHHVIGRASVKLPGNLPPDQANVIGVWVESQPVDGREGRSRSLYLPDTGLAELLVWDRGVWQSQFHLVSRGFTDVRPPKA